MSDNLKITKDKINIDIVDNGPESVKVDNHRDILLQVLEKTGKYTGASFKSRNTPVSGVVPAGTLFWNNNALNTTTDFVITLAKQTADLNDVGLLLNKMAIGCYIKFKDFVGRSAFLEYQSHTSDVDSNNDPVYLVTVKGLAENINYTYQALDDEICILEFIISGMPATPSEEFEIDVAADASIFTIPNTKTITSVDVYVDQVRAFSTDFTLNGTNQIDFGTETVFAGSKIHGRIYF